MGSKWTMDRQIQTWVISKRFIGGDHIGLKWKPLFSHWHCSTKSEALSYGPITSKVCNFREKGARPVGQRNHQWLYVPNLPPSIRGKRTTRQSEKYIVYSLQIRRRSRVPMEGAIMATLGSSWRQHNTRSPDKPPLSYQPTPVNFPPSQRGHSLQQKEAHPRALKTASTIRKLS